MAADEHDKTTPPGELNVIQLFVNTVDLETNEERLADPDATLAWLREHGLATGEDALGPVEVARLVAFREGLRTLLLSHHGEEADAGAIATLGATAAEAPLVVRFAADGSPGLAPALGGVEGVIGRLLAIIATAAADGTWARMKACPADNCRWAFYDHSRNRSRTWCSMEVCGNRAKARTYRTRAARRGER